jgi:hypothetical protein
MGTLPLQFLPGRSARSLGLTGDYHRHGGVLPYVLRAITQAPGRRDGPGGPGPRPG